MSQEVLVTEDGNREHIADFWSGELAELVAKLLNEHEAKNDK